MTKNIKLILSITLSFILSFSFIITPTNAATKAPKKVSVESILFSSTTNSSFYIKWSKAKRAKKYQVGYKIYNKKNAKWKYKTVKKNSTKLSKLKSNTTYSIKIKSINGRKKSKWTSTKRNTTISTAQYMLNQVNAKRKQAGAAPLALHSGVNSTAYAKAKDMYKKKRLSHYSSSLGYCWNQLDSANIPYIVSGENIAYGFSSVSKVMSAWMNSPGHRANILYKEYTHLGVGYYKGYWVQQFICVDENM